ncbi:hypothetical protein V3C99_004490 [Haemonchus contortus]
MKSQIAFLLLSSLSLVDGRDEFEERKQFHEQLCRKRPSLSKCSEPFTKSSYEKELMDHHEKGRSSLEMTAVRAFAARSAVKRESPWNDVDEDAEYEYYLWKKYRRAKLRQRLLEDRFESSPTIHQHYHYDRTNPYYNRPSYGYRSPYGSGYGYGYPSYGGSSYGYGYPSYGGYGYPSYGGYGGGYGGGLFNMGITRGLGISTPIGGFGIGSSFGIGIG